MNKPDFVEIVRYLLQSNTQMELQAKTGVHQHVISQLSRGVSRPQISYQYGHALIVEYDKQLKKDARLCKK